MKFRTEIDCSLTLHRISHQSKMMLMGSCFAESIGNKLSYFKFPVLVNPLGILFNPISLNNAVRFISNKKIFTEDDVVFHDGLWHSFYHHGSFSNADKQACLDNINQSITQAHEWLQTTATVIITLGTTSVWEYKTGLVVSNCHKIPSSDFKQYMLSVEQTEQALLEIIKNIKKVIPKATIIFTVSPIRYLHHGAHQSQISKATLLLAVDSVQQKNAGIEYFPSYEFLMDDLRDYRFYAEDMIHPSNQAVAYIWEKFADCYFDTQTHEINKKIDAYQRALSHRILNPFSESGIAFRKHIEKLKNELGKNLLL